LAAIAERPPARACLAAFDELGSKALHKKGKAIVHFATVLRAPELDPIDKD
jgi:hypothetical protein